MQTFQRRLGRLGRRPPARASRPRICDQRDGAPRRSHLRARPPIAACLLWNKACERLTGVPAEDMLGTRDHWRAFYDKRRPCLADLVLRQKFEDIALLYARGGRAVHGRAGASTENWCEMPRLGRPLYLAADAVADLRRGGRDDCGGGDPSRPHRREAAPNRIGIPGRARRPYRIAQPSQLRREADAGSASGLARRAFLWRC